MTQQTASRPQDFSLRYEWCAGSMPPPHHYEYTIHIGPGLEGEIVYTPDYQAHDPPVWTETFALEHRALDELYDLVVKADLLRESWPEVEDAPVGGSLQWLELVVGGRRCRVPAVLAEPELVAPVYGAIRALVPDRIWSDLASRRARFARDYDEHQG